MIQLIQGNALKLSEFLPANHFHTVATSPPYFGLRRYATGAEQSNEIGQEKLHDCSGWATGQNCGECFICHIRQFAAEV